MPNDERSLAYGLRNKFKDMPSYTLSGTTFDVKHFDKFLKRSTQNNTFDFLSIPNGKDVTARAELTSSVFSQEDKKTLHNRTRTKAEDRYKTQTLNRPTISSQIGSTMQSAAGSRSYHTGHFATTGGIRPSTSFMSCGREMPIKTSVQPKSIF